MFLLRPATPDDTPALQSLIARAGVELSVGYYTPAQAAAITHHVFGVDSQLVEDGTYFVVEDGDAIVACGGWSRRGTLFGGDQAKRGPDPLLDPAIEPARIRAFFVEPSRARRGLGRMLMARCIDDAIRAGFTSMTLVATLPGEPLYAASGFAVVERLELPLPGGESVGLTRMVRTLVPAHADGVVME